MSEIDHLRKTLEHYRKLRQQKLDEIKPILDSLKPIESMIRQLESDLNEPTSLTEPLNNAIGMSIERDGNPSESAPKKHLGLRPDEFFGLSQSDAAKAYLRKVGHAIPFDELVAALQRGGAKLGGKDPKKVLYVSLARNPRKEFVWPSQDHISLAEFYTGRK